MDIRDLKTFLVLCDTRHFALTAQMSHMTPSTLSRQIQRLEESVGQVLFTRDNRSVEITEAGQQLRLFAKKVLADYAELQQSLNKSSTQLTGELSLFCSVTASYSHLPDILERFRLLYPMVEIKLTTGDAADAVNKVQSNESDLAIAGRPKLLPNSIEFLKLGEIEMILLIPRLNSAFSDELHKKKPDWKNIPFIVPEHGPIRHQIDLWFKRNKISHPKIYATVSGNEAILPMVALGCGVALLPKVVMENSPDRIRERIIEWSSTLIPPFDIGICVQKRRLAEKTIAAFWELAK
ncbi:HTH-type transcriptional activator IlvY [Orbaceae bacterium ac157xtp]